MKLYYRGVSYEYDPSKVESRKRGQPFKQVRGSGHAYNLIYRGVTYRIDPNAKPSEAPVQPVAYRLMYRGIAYLVNKAAQREVTVVTQPTSTSKVIRSEDKYHGALTVLALLFTATLMQAPKIHQALKEAGKTLIEQLMLRSY